MSKVGRTQVATASVRFKLVEQGEPQIIIMPLTVGKSLLHAVLLLEPSSVDRRLRSLL